MKSGTKNDPIIETEPAGFSFESEDDRLRQDMERSPIEKLQLFTKMIRRNYTINQFKIKRDGYNG